MRHVLAILLLTTPAFADRDPVKCGRVLAERMFDVGLVGGGEVRLPKGCTRVLVPEPYSVVATSLGPVVMNPDGSVAASFLVPVQSPVAVAPPPCPVTVAHVARKPTHHTLVTGYHRRQIERVGRTVDILVED